MFSHRVVGNIKFYLNGEFYRIYVYNTSYQRKVIIDKVLEEVKNIRHKVVLYYVISIEEKTVNSKEKKYEHNLQRQ